MKRRDFLQLGVATSAGALLLKSFKWETAHAADAPKITEGDILKPGAPATIANYCENPEKDKKGMAKNCPTWKEGHCETCQFFNKDNSKTTFKGKSYAHCQLLSTKPQFVNEKEGWCATYVKKA